MTQQPDPTTPLSTAYGASLEQHPRIGRRLVAGAVLLGVLALLHAPLAIMVAALGLLGLIVLRR